MGNFLENVFEQLEKNAGRVVLREVRGEEFVSVTGRELLDAVGRARGFLRQAGIEFGDRVGLLGANSIEWVAIDLALMAEGAMVVPLYSRQAAAELAGMMRNCSPDLLLVSDAALGESVAAEWAGAPRRATFKEALADGGTKVTGAPNERADNHIVTIIYTSGTSGEPKGVCLSTGNLDFMLGCTTGWMDRLGGGKDGEPLRVFQYLPFNFAASWIVMQSCLLRDTVLTLSTDLNKLADEIRLSAPNYFFNVPTLLERVRRGVEDTIGKSNGLVRGIYQRGKTSWKKQHEEEQQPGGMWLLLARALIFKKILARFGPNLRGLVCGSAPLAPETQEFFAMLGIPIWQVYGLTETCGICTMDDPTREGEPGRVGLALPGVEMKTGENEEILVRGPNIFSGYWGRKEETARVLRDGWFYTGDQGEENSHGNWRISGRIKNLIILNSGHNIAPEPIEEKIALHLAGAQQVVVVGNGRGYLCALITGAVEPKATQAALDLVNVDLPHYRQVRSFTILKDALTPESGLLTANGKLKRDAINAQFANEIELMYRKNAAAAVAKG
jgi:long-chain acyl-CoA synthetase